MSDGPRLLLVTPLWPTPDLPHAGAFVRDRVGNDTRIRVVSVRRHDIPKVLKYVRLAWDALTIRGRYDGVEAHVLFPAGAIGMLTAWVRGVPIVVYVHGDEVRHVVYRRRVYTWLGRLVASRASAVVANSEDTAEHTRRLGRPEVIVNPPGIDLSRFVPTPRPPHRRVLYVGGDRSEKGIDVARRLADTLVGRGIREVHPADMPGLMASHDVLLMPSVEEGFGVAAAEAIASGRWVVAGAAGGLTEVVKEGVNGTLVSDGDFERALAEVPDYDPWKVAATASRFDVADHRLGMQAVWARVLGGHAVTTAATSSGNQTSPSPELGQGGAESRATSRDE